MGTSRGGWRRRSTAPLRKMALIHGNSSDSPRKGRTAAPNLDESLLHQVSRQVRVSHGPQAIPVQRRIESPVEFPQRLFNGPSALAAGAHEE